MTDIENDETRDAKEQLSKAELRQAPKKKFAVSGEDIAGDAKDANKSRKEKAKAQRAEDDNRLRKLMTGWAILFVGLQIVISDTLVIIYVITELRNGKDIAPQIIMAWLGTSLVEIIGILWVIARNLFPFHDKYRNKKAERRKER